MHIRHSLLLLAVLGCAAHAQPTCRVFKAFRSTASSTVLLDTILVTDDFPVSSVTVSSISLHHDLADTLELSLAHVGGPDVLLTPAVLRPAASSGETTGVYEPEAVVATSSAGQWVLRIVDKQPGAARRLITLSSWTLRLCSADLVTAAQGSQGPQPHPPLPRAMGPMPNISISISGNGVSFEMSNSTTDDSSSSSSTGDGAQGGISVRVGGNSSSSSSSSSSSVGGNEAQGGVSIRVGSGSSSTSSSDQSQGGVNVRVGSSSKDSQGHMGVSVDGSSSNESGSKGGISVRFGKADGPAESDARS